MKDKNPIRTALLKAGVANLREFGYPSCDAVNILTDPIYSAFFDRMLEDNIGKQRGMADKQILALRAEIAAVQEPI